MYSIRDAGTRFPSRETWEEFGFVLAAKKMCGVFVYVIRDAILEAQEQRVWENFTLFLTCDWLGLKNYCNFNDCPLTE